MHRDHGSVRTSAESLPQTLCRTPLEILMPFGGANRLFNPGVKERLISFLHPFYRTTRARCCRVSPIAYRLGKCTGVECAEHGTRDCTARGGRDPAKKSRPITHSLSHISEPRCALGERSLYDSLAVFERPNPEAPGLCELYWRAALSVSPTVPHRACRAADAFPTRTRITSLRTRLSRLSVSTPGACPCRSVSVHPARA